MDIFVDSILIKLSSIVDVPQELLGIIYILQSWRKRKVKISWADAILVSSSDRAIGYTCIGSTYTWWTSHEANLVAKVCIFGAVPHTLVTQWVGANWASWNAWPSILKLVGWARNISNAGTVISLKTWLACDAEGGTKARNTVGRTGNTSFS